MRRISSLVCVVALTACFDSNWGATKRAQTNNAAHAMPATLTPDEGDHSAVHVQGRRVRIHVTPAFTAQVVDYERQIRLTLEDASKVLAPLGIRLDVDRIVRWEDGGPEDELATVLKGLHDKDNAEGVDWVVAFVGSIPKVTDSFHDLGIADTPGKYLVLRAPNTVSETQAIDHAFDELDVDERAKLSNARKRHRATAICLHEIAHTLAAIHESDRESLMNPSFDSKMSGFSAGALSLMQVSLAHRDEPPSPAQQRSTARELLAVFESPSTTPWIQSERDATVARLRAIADPPQVAAPVHSAAPVASEAPAVAQAPELQPDDQLVYQRALTQRAASDIEGSWKTALPLFKRYPQAYAVQDLRCQLAMKRVGWPGAQAECNALMNVTRKH